MSAQASLRVRIQRTRWDHWAAVLLNASRSPVAWAVFLVAPIINACIMYLGARDDGASAQLAAVIGIFVISVVAMVVLLGLCYWLAARASWSTPGALKLISYEFDEDGVRVESTVGSGTSNWSVFTAVVEDKKLFLLRQRPGLIHILPKRDFEPGVLERLRAFAIRKIREQRGKV